RTATGMARRARPPVVGRRCSAASRQVVRAAIRLRTSQMGERMTSARGEAGDVYRGYNPPSLRGVHRRVLLLHDGRAKSLEQLLDGPHAPQRVTQRGKLTDQERADLLA